MERTELHRIAQQALRARAIDNRGRLHPGNLNRLGIELADLMLDADIDITKQARQIVEQGLALSSVLALGIALQQTLIDAGEVNQALHVARSLACLAVAVDNAAIATVRAEQEQIRAAVTRVLEQQRAELVQQHAEAERLSSLVNELSTPIVPVYSGILVLPLVGAIDSGRSSDLTDRLLTSISEHQADCVIIDITGVPVVDTSVAQHLLQTARAASLLGSTVIFTGIGPEIAQTIVQLGVELNGVMTLRDLEAGLTVALRRQKRAIQPLNQD